MRGPNALIFACFLLACSGHRTREPLKLGFLTPEIRELAQDTGCEGAQLREDSDDGEIKKQLTPVAGLDSSLLRQAKALVAAHERTGRSFVPLGPALELVPKPSGWHVRSALAQDPP